MKKHVIVFICILFSGSILAQTNFPFIGLGKIWSDLTHFDNTVSPEIFTTTYYKFGNDTINLQGKLYYPLYLCYNDSTMTNWVQQQQSYYREDSNKVYVSYGMEEDHLVYDFNLEQGDSVWIDPAYGYAHVARTDSALVCGAYHKKIYLTYNPWNDTIDTWIEGIGSLYSTFNPLSYHFLTDNTFQLLCVSDSICQLYQNPSYSGCFVSDTIPQAGIEIFGINHSFEISPNPIHQTCLVTLKEPNIPDFTVFLLNARGDVVFTEYSKTNPYLFNRKDLSSGLYFMVLVCKNMVLRKKVIID